MFARLVDRDVLAMRQRRVAVADHQRVEFDEAVALLVVIAGDFRARGQFIADAGRGQKLHPGADMNPWAHDGVVDQHLVHDPRQQAGMTEPFPRVDRFGFANIRQIFPGRVGRPGARHGAEPLAQRIGRRIHRLALGRPRRPRQSRKGKMMALPRQRCSAGRAKFAAALDLDRKHAVAFFAGDIGHLAVIDRLDKARLDQPAFEKGPAPFGDRQVHHVGHDIDARHQPAAKAVALRHRVVVHLVLGMF